MKIKLLDYDADELSFSFKFRSKTPATYSFDTLQLNQLRQLAPTVFPGDLRQCQQCEMLFFLSDLGKPYTRGQPNVYCTEDCRKKAYSGSSTERVQRLRARRAAPAAKHK